MSLVIVVYTFVFFSRIIYPNVFLQDFPKFTDIFQALQYASAIIQKPNWTIYKQRAAAIHLV